MGDLIMMLAGFLETRWPTNKNRLISRRLRLLKKSGVWNDLNVRYGPVVLGSTEFREFIREQNVEEILKNPARTDRLLREIEEYVKFPDQSAGLGPTGFPVFSAVMIGRTVISPLMII